MEYSLVVTVFLGIFGLAMGSFAGATVWRLRARQLREDAANGEKVTETDKKQVSKMKHASLLNDRSICLHCGHQLKWYDLIPLFSWLSLGGKCRYCHKRIGKLEPAIELAVALFFIVSYLAWPQPLTDPLELIRFVLWLISGVGLATLSVYDAKWFLLPNRIVFPLIGVGALNAIVVLIQYQFALDTILSILTACTILSGLYYLIYVLSKHEWVGFGDVKLGLVLALMLADWKLAILGLFLANVIGTLIVLPFLLGGKVKRQTHIPFGPMLISGWFIAGLFGQQILTWYISLTMGVL
jgi:prepilin signal peptidase PulO-like enzyme (type II secretory pathway)